MNKERILDMRRSEEKLSLAMREQADQLLVHQCVVRRFKKSQPEAFAALRSMRLEIQAALELHPASYFPATRPGRLDASVALLNVMHLFNDSSGRKALRRAAELEPDEAFQISELEPLLQLTEDSSVKVLRLLVQHLEMVQKLQTQFRFFDIYGVLAMSVHVEASELVKRYYVEYSRVRNGTDESPYSGLLPPELRWLSLLGGTRASKDVELLLGTGITSAVFVSDALEIFDDELNSVVMNGIHMKNGLYLRVRLDDVAPHQIDSALAYLRSALLGKARDRGIMRAVYAGHSFESSHFVRGMRRPLYFDVKRSGHLGLLLGLMCWDRIDVSNSRVEDAYREVIEEVARFSRAEKLAGQHYGEETARKNYKKITSAIGLGKKKNGLLDLFLTGSATGLDS
jgi:hypothetical protein